MFISVNLKKTPKSLNNIDEQPCVYIYNVLWVASVTQSFIFRLDIFVNSIQASNIFKAFVFIVMRGHHDSATKKQRRDNNQHNIQCTYSIVWLWYIMVEYAFNLASYLVGPHISSDLFFSFWIQW